MFLMTDGHDGYNALSKALGILGRAVFYPQVRRWFVVATHERKDTATTHQRVTLICNPYQIEHY
jgi:hypothetical protein